MIDRLPWLARPCYEGSQFWEVVDNEELPLTTTDLSEEEACTIADAPNRPALDDSDRFMLATALRVYLKTCGPALGSEGRADVFGLLSRICPVEAP